MRLRIRSELKPGGTAVSRAKLFSTNAPATASVIASATSHDDQDRANAAAAGRRVIAEAVLERRRAAGRASPAPAKEARPRASRRTARTRAPARRPRFRSGVEYRPVRTPRQPESRHRPAAMPQTPPIVERTMPSVRHCATRRAPARADREPDRRFAPAGRRAGEQQVRDVGARDQQHESDGAGQRHQRRLRVADDRLVRARQPHAPSFVRLRIGGLELCAGRRPLQPGPTPASRPPSIGRRPP